MAQTRVRLHWAVVLSTGAVIMVLGLLFFAAGLDDADKYASVIGALSTLAGLGLSISGMVQRSSWTSSRSEEGAAGGQRVQGSVVGGDVVQVRGVRGDVRIGGSSPSPAGSGAPQPEEGEEDETFAAPPGAQSVIGSRVGRSVIQVDRAGGDAKIERGA